MKLNQIGAQLYTARSLCSTPAETFRTLKKIADIGYAAVEVAGICPMESIVLNEMMADAGLVVCSIHERPEKTLAESEQVIRRTEELNCDYACYSFPVGYDLSNSQDVVRLKESLEGAGRKFREKGKTLCYHHHALEFARYESITVLDYLFRNIDSSVLSFELDTYWIQYGGGIPADWCQYASGRLPILHLKDYGVIGGEPTFMELGEGNLNWRPILHAAEQSGCKWFIVEQDVTPADPIESLRKSYDYLLPLVS